MPEHTTENDAPEPVALSIPDEDALFELLHALNVSGEHPELPCVMVYSVTVGRTTWHHAPFLATLTEPDAAHVNYIVSGEDGRSRCENGCEECGSDGDEPWTPPQWPVTALVGVWPDEKRCREDEINTWWSPSTPPGEGSADA